MITKLKEGVYEYDAYSFVYGEGAARMLTRIKKFKVNFGIDAINGKNCPKRMFLNLDVIISLLLLVSLCSILGYKMWIKYT